MALGNRPAGTPQPVEHTTTAAQQLLGPGLWYVHTDGTMYRLDAVPDAPMFAGETLTGPASIPRPVRDVVAALCAWVAEQHERAAERGREYITVASTDGTERTYPQGH